MSSPNPSSKTQVKKIQQLLADLNSGNLSKVSGALDALQVHGDWTVIKPLFEFVRDGEDVQAVNEVIEFLSSLKDTASKTAVMACLNDEELLSSRKEILSSIWNSPLDYSEYLIDFVRVAVSYDFLDTLESLTVIENLEGPFEEQAILESQLLLRDYHEGKFPKNREKDQLISEIAILIKDFDQNQQDLDDNF